MTQEQQKDWRVMDFSLEDMEIILDSLDLRIDWENDLVAKVKVTEVYTKLLLYLSVTHEEA